jgi:hypothetical protein
MVKPIGVGAEAIIFSYGEVGAPTKEPEPQQRSKSLNKGARASTKEQEPQQRNKSLNKGA